MLGTGNLLRLSALLAACLLLIGGRPDFAAAKEKCDKCKKSKKSEKSEKSKKSKKNKEKQEVVVLLSSDANAETVAKECGGSSKKMGKKKGLYKIGLPCCSSPSAMAALLKKLTGVKKSEAGLITQHCEGSQSTVPALGDDLLTKSYFEGQAGFGTVKRGSAHSYAKGTGVTVAVIDTGILSTHEYFSNRLSSTQFDFLDWDETPDESANGVDDDGDGTTDEAKGHGTFTAGIIASLAPGASIMPLRVLNDEGIGDSFALADAIFFATASGADVINLSLGLPAYSEIVEAAVQEALNNGVVVVVAAGNDGYLGSASINYPASMSGVIAVTSVDKSDAKASWASYHGSVALSAPGVSLLGPWLGSGNKTYASWSGTSFSAPMVSAAAALVLEGHSTYTPSQVKTAILNGVVDVDNLNELYKGTIGAGRLNLLSIVQ